MNESLFSWGKMFMFVVAYINMINDIGNLTERHNLSEYSTNWVGLCEMGRLHRLSITGNYARISLGLRLSRACNNKSDWLIRSP